MEDHRWVKHPNVWGFYYEFVTDQAPGVNWVSSIKKPSLFLVSTMMICGILKFQSILLCIL